MKSTHSHHGRGAFLVLAALAFSAPTTPANEAPEYDTTPLKPTPWEPTLPRDVTRDRLTAADWVGPDGIVYPNWTWAGVHRGEPGRRKPGIPVREDVVASLPESLAGEAQGEAFTTALQAALDAAGAAGGGVVRIPAGTFHLVRPLLVRHDRVVLRGAGRGQSAEPDGRDDPAETRLRFTFGYGPDDDGNPGPDVALLSAPRHDRLTRDGRLNVYASAFSPKASGAACQGGGKSSHIHGFYLTFAVPGREPATWAISRDPKDRAQHTRWTSFGVAGPTDSASIPAADLADLLKDAATVSVQARVRWRWFEPDDKERTWIVDEAEGPAVAFSLAFGEGAEDPLRGTVTEAIAFLTPANPWRDRRAHTLQDHHRGDTELLLSHPDLAAAEAAGVVPGAALRIGSYTSQSFADAIERDGGSGVPRDHMATVLSVEPAEGGVRVRIEQPLQHDAPFNEGQVETWSAEKKGYVRTGDRSTWASGARLQAECAVENLVLEQTRRGWFNGIAMGDMINSWVRNVRVERAGRDPLRLGGMMTEMRDCELIDARWANNAAGGSAYLHGSTYGLIENVYGRNLRHAPNFTGHTAGVVRNSRFFSSDMQWHQNWGRAHLFENVTVDALQGTGSYGWAAFAQRSLADIHGPGMGPRNCIYNCDLIGPKGGIFLGGKSEGPLILHNRVRAWSGPGMVLRYHVFNGIFLGNVFAVQNRFDPAVLFGDPERDNNRLNRTEARPKPLPHPLLGTANPGNDFIGNTLYGGSGELQAGPWQFGGAHAEWRSSFGNVVKAWNPNPPRPQPAMASVFETQRAHPEGFADRLDPAQCLYPPSPTGGAQTHVERDDGEPVVQINFRDKRGDRGDQSEHWRGEDPGKGWWSDMGEPFGEKPGPDGATLRYGWVDGKPDVRQESIWSDDDFRYRTTADWPAPKDDPLRPFGRWTDNRDLAWQIELEPGVYNVFLAAGSPRKPERFTWPDERPLPFLQVNDFLLNGVLLKDPGQSDVRRDAFWATVTVGENRLLALRPAPTAITARIAFLQIYRQP